MASIRRILQRFNGDSCRAKPEFLHIERLIFEFQLLTCTCKVMEELPPPSSVRYIVNRPGFAGGSNS
jgi:hypothetical protein